MRKLPIVLDLETKYTFRERNNHKNLEVSAVAVYDYATQRARVFLEQELQELFRLLEQASHIVGYNVRSFDLQVLQRYYPGNLSEFPIVDMLDDIKNKIGRRLGLNDVVGPTLNKKKTGHGLLAIDYFKEGKIDQLKQYALDDVTLTRELFDFGVNNGHILYLKEVAKTQIPVEWKQYFAEVVQYSERPLTLPF